MKKSKFEIKYIIWILALILAYPYMIQKTEIQYQAKTK